MTLKWINEMAAYLIKQNMIHSCLEGSDMTHSGRNWWHLFAVENFTSTGYYHLCDTLNECAVLTG